VKPVEPILDSAKGFPRHLSAHSDEHLSHGSHTTSIALKTGNLNSPCNTRFEVNGPSMPMPQYVGRVAAALMIVAGLTLIRLY
jgi:hypothetical protein